MRKMIVCAWLASMIVVFGATTQALAVFMASATGSQQIGEAADSVRGILTDATCVLVIKDANSSGELPYTLQCFDIGGVTQAHLHVGAPDATGPLAAALFGPVEGQDFNGTVAEGILNEVLREITIDELMDLLNNDGVYLNIHTEAHPPGEVRGQVVPIDDTNVVDEFYLATASGGQNRPTPVMTDATCLGSFRARGDNLKYKVKCFNIEGITQVHLHIGPGQSGGPVAAFLFPAGDPTGPVNGIIRRDNGDQSKGTLRSEDLLNDLMGAPISDLVERMRTDDIYLNVHTEANPPGETRGQVTRIGTLAGGF